MVGIIGHKSELMAIAENAGDWPALVGAQWESLGTSGRTFAVFFPASRQFGTGAMRRVCACTHASYYL